MSTFFSSASWVLLMALGVSGLLGMEECQTAGTRASCPSPEAACELAGDYDVIKIRGPPEPLPCAMTAVSENNFSNFSKPIC